MSTNTQLPDLNDAPDERESSLPPDTPTKRRSTTTPEQMQMARNASARNRQARQQLNSDRDEAAITISSSAEASSISSALSTLINADMNVLIDILPLEDGLQIVFQMRQQCDRLAKCYEQKRMSAHEQMRCTTCNRTLAECGKQIWRMQTYRIDLATQTKYPVQFCSDSCIVENNRKQHGLGVMSDRGMTSEDSRETHRKTALMRHQEKIAQDKALADLGKEMTKRQKGAAEKME